MTKDEWYKQLFERLDNSKFRSSFHLKQKDIDYINEKGLDTIRQHAKDFIAKRDFCGSNRAHLRGYFRKSAVCLIFSGIAE